MKTLSGLQTIFSAADAAATGKAHFVENADKMVFEFATASSANLTVKFQGSISDTQPDFSAAQTASNHWDYIEVIDLEDGSAVDGDTGIVLAGTDDFRLFSANVDGLRWVCATITARSAGTLTLKVKTFVNC